jgi:N-acetylmuramoyl-L-alanine amidase
MTKLVVILDAGHGPNTPGKRSPDGFREYNFNHPTTRLLGAELLKYKDVVVEYVYDTNGTDTLLNTRTDRANTIAAKYKGTGAKVIYISVHANAFGTGWNDANGIETFIYPSRPAEAEKLAREVQHELIVATKMNDRGVKTANFHVLRETSMTAILVECGFMTNKSDCEALKSPTFQKKVALGITKGIVDTFSLTLKPVPKPAPAPTPKGNLYRVIVDGNQVGAYGDPGNVAGQVEKYIKAGKNKIQVERV